VSAPAEILVGMGETKLSREAPLTALGLGSCIGLIAFCPATSWSGMAHIMLPEAFPGQGAAQPGKFADTALPHLLEQIRKAGGGSLLRFAYAGGAQVFQFGSDTGSRLDVGRRNSEAVERLLREARLRSSASDVGGGLGRTLRFDPASREATVRTVKSPPERLVKF
jgi:chemotaxis protein CheD